MGEAVTGTRRPALRDRSPGMLFQADLTLLGYFIVLLSSVFFCVQNVVVRVMFTAHSVLGIGTTGGFLPPTLQNSLLLLLLRMVLAVPLMALLAGQLYPHAWKDLRQLRAPSQRRGLYHALAGGGLMFAYLALLYLAIGMVATGIALTLFFTFPVFTALFSWRFFGSRPTGFRWIIMALVLVGSALTVPRTQFQSTEGSWLGVGLGVAAGVAYALYTVNAQKSFEHLHPVPYTWISFAVTLLLAALCLLLWPLTATDLAWGPLWIGSLLSGLVTFAGHVLYNSGIRLVGATSAAMIGSTNPALTVVLAWVAIQESLSLLQLLGVGVVTLSVAALSRERSRSQTS